jgi:hypothetical protein
MTEWLDGRDLSHDGRPGVLAASALLANAVFIYVPNVQRGDHHEVGKWFGQWGHVHRIKNVHKSNSYFETKIAKHSEAFVSVLLMS